jgi:hypothetical protein
MKLPDKIFSKNKEFAWRIIDGSAYIVDSKGSMMHELNTPGARIWELIDGKHDLEEITCTICNEFDVMKESAGKDLVRFIEEIQKKGLVKEK